MAAGGAGGDGAAVTARRWVYRLGHRCAADFIALPGLLTQTFPRAR
jgi:hypothetical protein